MKNLLKKFAVITASMMLAMTSFVMPSFASDTPTPAPVDQTVIKINGLPGTGVVVKAYKIVKQDTDGKWENVYPGGVTISDKGEVSVSSDQITALAAKTDKTNEIGGFEYVEGVWQKDLKGEAKYGTENNKGAGMYLVLVENTPDKDGKQVDTGANKEVAEKGVRVYNPMIVSIGPDKDTGKLVAGSVDPTTDKFDTSEDGVTGTAYAKSSQPGVDKYIIRDSANPTNQTLTGTTNVANGLAHGEGKYGDTDTRGIDPKDAKNGDKVFFEIDTTIPAYAKNFTNPTFNIYDTLSAGLAYNQDVKVYVGGTEVKPTAGDNKTWTVTNVTAGGFKIVFDPAYLLASEGISQKDVKVVYSATVQPNCKENFDAETNTAKIEYSRNPGEDVFSEEITTYHYTFSINGRINGAGSDELREVVKVGCTAEGDFVFAETLRSSNAWEKNIEGAKFNLYKKADYDKDGTNAPVYRTATSDPDGRLMGLDRLDAGEYVLVETEVPSPFKVKNTAIPVKIEAWLKDNGQLEKYEITVDGVKAGSYTATYAADKTISTINGKATSNRTEGDGNTDASKIGPDADKDLDKEAADIRNTKTGSLPSTGGMGTILFTVGGIVLIGLAFLLLFGGRRRQHQK